MNRISLILVALVFSGTVWADDGLQPRVVIVCTADGICTPVVVVD